MKKLKRIMLLIFITLTMTGCVKMEISMDINKDKSMTFGIIEAVNKSLLDSGASSSLLDEDQKKELEEDGYTIETYAENDMEGFKITKEIKNIDEVSTENEITADLGASELSNNEYLFTVKKGLFKNTYKAVLKSTDTDEIDDSLNSQLQDDTLYDDDLTTDDDYYYDEDSELTDDWYADDSTDDWYTDDSTDDEYLDDSMDDFDYTALMSSMDLKMKVNLPYKALSSNATSVENDGKTLTWDLMNFEAETIEFEFELYNTTNIIITVIAGILVLLLIICLIINKSKPKKQPSQNVETLNNNTQSINTVNTNLTQEQNLTTQQTSLENNNISESTTAVSLNQEPNLPQPQPIIENINVMPQPINVFESQSNNTPESTITNVAAEMPINNNINNAQTTIPQVPLINPADNVTNIQVNNTITNSLNNNVTNQIVENQQSTITTPATNTSTNSAPTPQSYDIFTINFNNNNPTVTNQPIESPVESQQSVTNNNVVNNNNTDNTQLQNQNNTIF